jgi:hypothetical protein
VTAVERVELWAWGKGHPSAMARDERNGFTWQSSIFLLTIKYPVCTETFTKKLNGGQSEQPRDHAKNFMASPLDPR